MHLVHGPMAVTVCADVQLPCYHRRPCRHPRSRAKLVPQGHTATGGNGNIETQLLPKTMLGSMVLVRLESELKSGFFITTNGHKEARGWNCNLRPWCCLIATQLPELFPPEWLLFLPRAGLLYGSKPRAMSASVA